MNNIKEYSQLTNEEIDIIKSTEFIEMKKKLVAKKYSKKI